MKLPAKAITSPGRTEKFPPPLMRFLRTNIGNKSQRATTTPRSRSSPMFLRKKPNAIETTQQEPSSPKVTCMGQVRVRKKSSSKSSATKRHRPKKAQTFVSCRCQWIPRALFCRQIRPKISMPLLRKWGSFFQLSFRRRDTCSDNNNNNKIESNSFEREGDTTEDSDSEQSTDDKSRAYVAEPRPIPKNALILTRCRSAPYRSSSLASRFWESPLSDDSEEKQSREREREKEKEKERERAAFESKSENEERPISEKGTESEESEVSNRAGDQKEVVAEEAELGLGLGLGLAILTRCKSEPARMGENLYPEIGYWNNNNNNSYSRRRRRTRLGFC